MATIDSQVHAYERNHPGRPWAEVLRTARPRSRATTWSRPWTPSASMARCWSRRIAMYRYDASYALEVHAAHPGRFGLVKPVDPNDPKVAETIAEWAATTARSASAS